MSRGKLLDSAQPWTDKDLEILREHYWRAGGVGCQRYLSSRSAGEITARANKLGLRFRKNRKPSRVVQANMEKTGGPRPYQYLVQPWQKQEQLPRRPGSMDFAELPSLK